MFNRLSSMVVESILFCDESSRRHILAYMIKLAKKFLKVFFLFSCFLCTLFLFTFFFLLLKLT